MQYLGYVVIAIAVYAGVAPWHPGSVIALALVSSLLFMSARQKALKEEGQRTGSNLLLDGAYLFAGQCLIIFTAYLTGWLFANMFGG